MPQAPSSAHLETGAVTLSIADVRNPHVRAGVDYWHSLRGQRRFPARADLALRGMAAILPFAVIVAVEGGGADYEFRYVGDAQRQAFSTHFKGMRLTQIEAAAPELGAIVRGAYEHVRATGVPLLVRGRVDHEPANSRFLYHETAFLPLGASDDAVDHLLIVGVQVPEPFWKIPAEKLTVLADKTRTPAAAT